MALGEEHQNDVSLVTFIPPRKNVKCFRKQCAKTKDVRIKRCKSEKAFGRP